MNGLDISLAAGEAKLTRADRLWIRRQIRLIVDRLAYNARPSYADAIADLRDPGAYGLWAVGERHTDDWTPLAVAGSHLRCVAGYLEHRARERADG